MYTLLLSQLDDFISNPLEVPQDAVSFVRLCQAQIETLKVSIEEKPVPLAVHRKAVVLYLREVGARCRRWECGAVCAPLNLRFPALFRFHACGLPACVVLPDCVCTICVNDCFRAPGARSA